MQAFLFGSYQLLSLALYFLLSAALLYHRLVARWVRFSSGFFILYLIGAYVFFGRMALPLFSQDALLAAPYIAIFVGFPILLGWCLVRGFGFPQVMGIFLIYGFSIVLVLVLNTNIFDKPFGFFYQLGPRAKEWVELTSFFTAIFGLIAMMGFGYLYSLNSDERLGTILLFFAVMGVAFTAIHLTLGYEYLGPSLERAWESIPLGRR